MPCGMPVLNISDIDGIFTAGQHSPALLGEALGISPRYIDGTSVGGCSFIIMVGHALLALHHGLCDVAVVSHGESGRSDVGVTRGRDTALSGQYEIPYGFGPAPTNFGMITTRHMHEYGTTLGAMGSGGGINASMGRAESQSPLPRSPHHRGCAQVAAGMLPFQLPEYLSGNRCRRGRGADPC